MSTHQTETADTNLAIEAYPGELDELRAKASRTSHLVDHLPAGVIVIDGKGIVAEANQIASDLLSEPLEGERWIEVIDRAFAPQADDGAEVSLKDGRRVQIQTQDLFPYSGQLVLLTDLTETRLLQARLANMKHLSVLGKLMASLAHQIRTPLSAAMLYAANLGNSSLTHQARSNFQNKLIDRLHDLENQITDMLLFARSGKQQVAETLSLQTLLTEVKAGADAMMLQAKAQMTLDLPDPDILIYGNQNALASAIQNLIHNSIEIIGEDAQLDLAAKADPEDKNFVIISVKDNGPGINQEQINKVFEPFYTTRGQGTGLGLAVVKSVVEQHNGQISIESKQSQGAKFIMRLPIAEVAMSAQQQVA
ncbi:sensor histidine kinase [Marinifaba aquimaris]|uniref:sensor histidine kinase n=1 Tax=Marinifaba aquimaris TaxID=2741323 RepID=UPI001C2D1145|nr:ATP-binding protein [Marinifaba aquimaris]